MGGNQEVELGEGNARCFADRLNLSIGNGCISVSGHKIAFDDVTGDIGVEQVFLFFERLAAFFMLLAVAVII